MTTVVNKDHDKYDILITRETKWGNPFHIGKDGTREEVIEKYRKWIVTQPLLIALLETLKGKRLGCVCKPLNNCHGDVLVELIEYYNPPGTMFLYQKPPHLIINQTKWWVDLSTTGYAHRYELCQDLYVWLTEYEGDLEYAILSGKDVLYANKSIEAITMNIDMINFERKTR